MKRLLICITLLISCTATISNTATVTASVLRFNYRDHPVYLIASYYNAITLRDFERAYSYWNGHEPHRATLAEFTAGMSNTDTESIRVLARLPIRYGVAAGTIHAEVPIVLLSKLRTGEQQIFAGCFHTAKSNVPAGNATEPDPNWYLYSASLQPATSVDFVQAANECMFVNSFPVEGGRDNRYHSLELITSYYDAIASHDYSRAYNYWQREIPGQTLAQFAEGFTGTNDIGVVIALTIHVEGAAGLIFTSTPVMITAKNSGTPQLFIGCLATNKPNLPAGSPAEPDPKWSLFKADMVEVQTFAVALQEVWTACSEL